MQLAVNALIPSTDGGMSGSTLYISTEGVPDTLRMNTMLTKLRNHVNIVRAKNKSKEVWNDDSLLDKVGIVKCNDLRALLDFLKALPTMARERGCKLGGEGWSEAAPTHLEPAYLKTFCSSLRSSHRSNLGLDCDPYSVPQGQQR